MTSKMFVLFSFLIAGCGSSSPLVFDAGNDASSSIVDGSNDAVVMCTYADAGPPSDGGGMSGGGCTSAAGCPSGTVCVIEVGGVAGGGGGRCAPIPNECHGTPTCACMAGCACAGGAGHRPETCSEQNGTISCDNGIR